MKMGSERPLDILIVDDILKNPYVFLGRKEIRDINIFKKEVIDKYGGRITLDITYSAEEGLNRTRVKDYDVYLIDAQMELDPTILEEVYDLRSNQELMKEVKTLETSLEDLKKELVRGLVIPRNKIIKDIPKDVKDLSFEKKEIFVYIDGYSVWLDNDVFNPDVNFFNRQTGVRLVDSLIKEGKKPFLHTKAFDHGPYTFVYGIMKGILNVNDIISAYRSIKENKGFKLVELYDFGDQLIHKLSIKNIGISENGNMILNPKIDINQWVDAIKKAVEYQAK